MRAIGKRVMAVVATAGSTATGSFDDLEAIASICDEHGVWLHVDAAHGGSALLSPTHRHRVRGIERARSIAWDPHKMMLLPMQAGMLLVRDERDLDVGVLAARAVSLSGAATASACGIRARETSCARAAPTCSSSGSRFSATAPTDSARCYDHFCALARVAVGSDRRATRTSRRCTSRSRTFCASGTSATARSDDGALDQLNRELRERYNQSGEGWITATNLDGRRVLRVTMMNPRTTAADVRDMLDGLHVDGDYQRSS